MKLGLTLALILVAPSPILAQLQIDTGTGNLFGGNAAAVGAHLYRPGITDYVGLTYIDKRVIPGASTEFKIRGTDLTIGSQQLSLNQDMASVTVACFCLSARRQSKSKTTSVTAFMGETGPAFFLPSAFGIVPRQPGLGILFVHDFYFPHTMPGVYKPSWLEESHFEFSSLDALAGVNNLANTSTVTSAQSLTYSYRRNLKIIGSAGLINGSSFYSGSGAFQAHGVALSAAHEEFFYPFAAVSDSASASLSHSVFNLGAGVNQSRSLGLQILGENVNAGFHVGPVTENSGWYRSGSQSFISHFVTERIRRHFLLTENVGQGKTTSVNAGGSVLFNHFSASVNHSIQFVIGRGYINVTGFSLSFRIHDTSLTASTVTDPFGHTLWMVNQTSYLQVGAGALPGQVHRAAGGKFEITGTCLDAERLPVAGCTIHVGKDVVVSNSRGLFTMYVSKNRPLPVAVNPEEFAAPGTFSIVLTPATAQPGEDIVVMVKRQ